MRNILQHKPADQPIGDGEISIDTIARTLKTRTQRGEVTVPLDFVALAPRDDNGSSLVYVYRDSGVAEVSEYSAGGGGQAHDGRPWRVPGLSPTVVDSVNIASVKVTPFEVAYPLLITGISLRIISGIADINMVILTEDGQYIANKSVIQANPSDQTHAVSISLNPGRYVTRIEVSSPIVVRTINGYAPWHNGVLAHPLMMQVSV